METSGFLGQERVFVLQNISKAARGRVLGARCPPPQPPFLPPFNRPNTFTAPAQHSMQRNLLQSPTRTQAMHPNTPAGGRGPPRAHDCCCEC